MKLTSTMQNHLRGLSRSTYQLILQVARFAKDLYNSALYIQRQHFFSTGTILSLGKLFGKVKTLKEYRQLPSDLAQQILIGINQNFRSFFKLLAKKKQGTYTKKVRLPNYLDKDGYAVLTFISRLFKQEKQKQGSIPSQDQLRLSLGHRGKRSTGTRFFYLPPSPLGIEPKQIRLLPRYDGFHIDIEYIYEIESIPREKPPLPDSFLSVDLGLDNFATCVTTTETAFILEGSGVKSFNRWWNKQKAKYQSQLDRQGIKGMTRRMARMQRYRRDVINNFLNHVVRYLIDFCLEQRIATIVVGDWSDMKNGLKMQKTVGQLFQTLPYGWFKQKLEYKAQLHNIGVIFQEESYTSQDCFNCGLRRRANRRHRGLYRCISCSMELNADVNGALNIMKKVAPEQVVTHLQWGSGEITSPSRIRLVEFV